ncbi:amidohydrolase [Virgibacillus siamensis]|uniref:amidohydrolase n=1 Tax=Virgibacillus siamensis TaxID=480071 RepID=UPI0009869883|nr:amidohydrolase [Virgibacillus siamensis]
MQNDTLAKKIIEWRRDFHQYPETGFLEMRTASIAAGILESYGLELKMGKEVMSADHCMGKPNEEETKKHLAWAKENGANTNYLDYFSEGYTGIVATLDTGKNGPTVAFRVDMDALPIYESTSENHIPLQKGFRSVNDNMHACGHDAHTSIGLGLAALLAENQESLQGKFKLIFQPAEEGTRGARSMVEAGVVSDVDYLIASHIGTGVPYMHVVAANNGFLATSKLDVSFTGVASHAGGNPEQGKNALLAAANIALNLSAIPRHSKGVSRVNVGEMHAGSGRNVIPDKAALKVETRGETSEINDFVKQQAKSIVSGAAAMYGVDYDMELVGEGISCTCSNELAAVVHESTVNAGLTGALESNESAGSEDATFFIDAVQRQGGYGTYCIFGTDLAAGHHNEKFDINEETLLPAVEILYNAASKLCKK